MDRVLEVRKYRKDNFSLVKLEVMLADLPMMVVFCKYLSLEELDPSHRSNVIQLAYYEAALRMVTHTRHLKTLARAFDFRSIFALIDDLND